MLTVQHLTDFGKLCGSLTSSYDHLSLHENPSLEHPTYSCTQAVLFWVQCNPAGLEYGLGCLIFVFHHLARLAAGNCGGAGYSCI